MIQNKYLHDGQMVRVVEKTKSGYLYQMIYHAGPLGEDLVDEDNTYFAEQLFDAPPTEKLHEEIVSLKTTISELKNQVSQLEEAKINHSNLLKGIKQRPFIQCLVDYMNQDFEYVMYLNNMMIIEKSKVYISPFIKITCTRKGGFSLYKLHSENYDSYDDHPIMIFKSFEEGQEFAKAHLLDTIEKCTSQNARYPWRPDSIKKWYTNIHKSIKLQNDPDILKIYKEKLEQAQQKENQEKKLKIEQEIEERKAKLKDL